MTTTTHPHAETSAAVNREHLPALPSWEQAHMLGGYEWMDALRGWAVVSLWGRDGYDCGQWPYQICAVTDQGVSPGYRYGMVTYCEGDYAISTHATKADLHHSIDRYAFETWKARGNGPRGLPARFEDLPEYLRGPVRHIG